MLLLVLDIFIVFFHEEQSQLQHLYFQYSPEFLIFKAMNSNFILGINHPMEEHSNDLVITFV